MIGELLNIGEELTHEEETFLFGDPGNLGNGGDIAILGRKVDLALSWLAQHWPENEIPLELFEAEQTALQANKVMNAKWLREGLIDQGSDGMLSEDPMHPILLALQNEEIAFINGETSAKPFFSAAMLHTYESRANDPLCDEKLNYVYGLMYQDFDFHIRSEQPSGLYATARFPTAVSAYTSEVFPMHLAEIEDSI